MALDQQPSSRSTSRISQRSTSVHEKISMYATIRSTSSLTLFPETPRASLARLPPTNDSASPSKDHLSAPSPVSVYNDRFSKKVQQVREGRIFGGLRRDPSADTGQLQVQRRRMSTSNAMGSLKVHGRPEEMISNIRQHLTGQDVLSPTSMPSQGSFSSTVTESSVATRATSTGSSEFDINTDDSPRTRLVKKRMQKNVVENRLVHSLSRTFSDAGFNSDDFDVEAPPMPR